MSIGLRAPQELPLLPVEQHPADQADQSLCLACGLCCDGTLFGQTSLGALDDAAALSGLGVEPASDLTRPALKQPCAAYRNCACSIYAHRPHACRQFRCALLQRFRANKISQRDALDVIKTAITLRDNVKQQMPAAFGEEHCNFDEFSLRLKSSWKDASAAETKECVSALFQSFAAFWFHINKHFKPEWRR